MLAWVAYLLLVSATLSVAGFALERSLRAHGLTIRWIWLCVLCASLVLPVVLSAAARALPAGGAASRPPSAVTSTAAAPAVSASRTLQFPAASRGSVAPDLDPLIAALWLASSAATALVVLAGCEYGRRRRRAWRRISVAGTPLLVARDAGPATVGLLRPQIVVPEWLLRAAPETLQLVIAHERSHVEARDPRLLALGFAIAVLMPWNVLVWWQVHRLRLAIEVDCDRRVLRGGHDARRYARALVEIGTRRPVFIGGLAASPGSASCIERRILLMNTPAIHGLRARTAAGALLSLAAAAAVLLISPPAIPAAVAAITGSAAEPAALERYVGSYEFSTVTVLEIALANGQLTARFAGGPAEPLTQTSGQQFRLGKAGCCSPDSDAYVRFANDAAGRVIGAVFQQNGIATIAPRIDAQRVRAIDGAISARLHSQAAAPGSEAALRELIDGIASSSPRYGDLSPQLAAGTRAMLADLQATMKPWGALRSVEFRGVDEKGWDQYLVRFERGAAAWKIGLDSYGLIVGAETHPESN
jgi:bla regulator protein BlaR1